MEIKEALLEIEYNNIKSFLEKNDLLYDNLITKSFYISDDDKVVGTVSIYNNVIKCFAVDKNYREENYGSALISFIINYFYQNNINNYLVFTKLEYASLFMALNFHEITRTQKVILLESGSYLINDYINDLKKKIGYHFSIDISKDNDIACLVLNANPITIGHMELIEKASKEHNYVLIFILEEDLSYFSYKERLSLVTISTLYLHNVLVVPSSEYIISSATFPNYFLKNEDIKNDEWSIIDAKIFKDYFIDKLNIKCRYVGTEKSVYMARYNNILKEVLGDKLIEVDRFKLNEEIISASSVRELVKTGKIEEAMKFIPNGAKTLFYSIAKNK